MMFRRCCPPYSRQPHPHTCQMTGQGDGQTAQRYAAQQASQAGMVRSQRPACRCQAKQPCSLQSARAQLLESIAREEMGIANLLAAAADARRPRSLCKRWVGRGPIRTPNARGHH